MYQPRHLYEIDLDGVSDNETVELCRNAMAVTAGSLHGFVYGPWLEARISRLVQECLPEWQCSHSQLTGLDDQSLQSRSWDVVVHRPPPAGWPPASHPPNGYPLLPTACCCAAVNVKGNFSPAGLRRAAREPAYEDTGDSTRTQMDYLGPHVPVIFFCFTAYASHAHMDRVAGECGMRAFTLARLFDK